MFSEQRDPPSRVANAPPGTPRPGGYAMSPAAQDASAGLSHNPNPLLAWLRALGALPAPLRARLLAMLLARRAPTR